MTSELKPFIPVGTDAFAVDAQLDQLGRDFSTFEDSVRAAERELGRSTIPLGPAPPDVDELLQQAQNEVSAAEERRAQAEARACKQVCDEEDLWAKEVAAYRAAARSADISIREDIQRSFGNHLSELSADFGSGARSVVQRSKVSYAAHFETAAQKGGGVVAGALFRPEAHSVPNMMDISPSFIRGLRNKVPSGYYVLRVTLLDNVGGRPVGYRSTGAAMCCASTPPFWISASPAAVQVTVPAAGLPLGFCRSLNASVEASLRVDVKGDMVAEGGYPVVDAVERALRQWRAEKSRSSTPLVDDVGAAAAAALGDPSVGAKRHTAATAAALAAVRQAQASAAAAAATASSSPQLVSDAAHAPTPRSRARPSHRTRGRGVVYDDAAAAVVANSFEPARAVGGSAFCEMTAPSWESQRDDLRCDRVPQMRIAVPAASGLHSHVVYEFRLVRVSHSGSIPSDVDVAIGVFPAVDLNRNAVQGLFKVPLLLLTVLEGWGLGGSTADFGGPARLRGPSSYASYEAAMAQSLDVWGGTLYFEVKDSGKESHASRAEGTAGTLRVPPPAAASGRPSIVRRSYDAAASLFGWKHAGRAVVHRPQRASQKALRLSSRLGIGVHPYSRQRAPRGLRQLLEALPTHLLPQFDSFGSGKPSGAKRGPRGGWRSGARLSGEDLSWLSVLKSEATEGNSAVGGAASSGNLDDVVAYGVTSTTALTSGADGRVGELEESLRIQLADARQSRVALCDARQAFEAAGVEAAFSRLPLAEMEGDARPTREGPFRGATAKVLQGRRSSMDDGRGGAAAMRGGRGGGRGGALGVTRAVAAREARRKARQSVVLGGEADVGGQRHGYAYVYDTAQTHMLQLPTAREVLRPQASLFEWKPLLSGLVWREIGGRVGGALDVGDAANAVLLLCCGLWLSLWPHLLGQLLVAGVTGRFDAGRVEWSLLFPHYRTYDASSVVDGALGMASFNGSIPLLSSNAPLTPPPLLPSNAGTQPASLAEGDSPYTVGAMVAMLAVPHLISTVFFGLLSLLVVRAQSGRFVEPAGGIATLAFFFGAAVILQPLLVGIGEPLYRSSWTTGPLVTLAVHYRLARGDAGGGLLLTFAVYLVTTVLAALCYLGYLVSTHRGSYVFDTYRRLDAPDSVLQALFPHDLEVSPTVAYDEVVDCVSWRGDNGCVRRVVVTDLVMPSVDTFRERLWWLLSVAPPSLKTGNVSSLAPTYVYSAAVTAGVAVPSVTVPIELLKGGAEIQVEAACHPVGGAPHSGGEPAAFAWVTQYVDAVWRWQSRASFLADDDDEVPSGHRSAGEGRPPVRLAPDIIEAVAAKHPRLFGYSGYSSAERLNDPDIGRASSSSESALLRRALALYVIDSLAERGAVSDADSRPCVWAMAASAGRGGSTLVGGGVVRKGCGRFVCFDLQMMADCIFYEVDTQSARLEALCAHLAAHEAVEQGTTGTLRSVLEGAADSQSAIRRRVGRVRAPSAERAPPGAPLQHHDVNSDRQSSGLFSESHRTLVAAATPYGPASIPVAQLSAAWRRDESTAPTVTLHGFHPSQPDMAARGPPVYGALISIVNVTLRKGVVQSHRAFVVTPTATGAAAIVELRNLSQHLSAAELARRTTRDSPKDGSEGHSVRSPSDGPSFLYTLPTTCERTFCIRRFAHTEAEAWLMGLREASQIEGSDSEEE